MDRKERRVRIRELVAEKRQAEGRRSFWNNHSEGRRVDKYYQAEVVEVERIEGELDAVRYM